jgi:hypothetical protein
MSGTPPRFHSSFALTRELVEGRRHPYFSIWPTEVSSGRQPGPTTPVDRDRGLCELFDRGGCAASRIRLVQEARMIRTTLGAVAIALALGIGSAVTLAEQAQQPPPAAAPASKANGAEKTESCMPDGSCCGNGACAKAAADTAASGQKAAGGCPCGKMKKAQPGTDKPS